MTIQDIYELAITRGIAADPRGKTKVTEILRRLKKEYADSEVHWTSSPEKKKYFDKESLINPYSDSRILFGDPKLKVKKIMAGIDAEEAEVLLVDRLNQKGEGIDLLVSHHPSGHAYASLDEVMDLQVDTFAEAGVPENVAHALFDERRQVVRRKVGPMNHSRAVDAARLLNIPLLALHTIWDNLGNKFVEDLLAKKKYNTVGEIFEDINQIPEFAEAIKGKSGPSIVAGSEKRRAGKIIVEFTGGTSPSKELYMELAKAGVGTIVTMHIPEDGLEELKKLHISVIDCGHMAADSIGANIFLDELEKRGVEVIPCSGLIRVRRKAKA
jgi:putative NIF3 family GTP cyclohydrolase 1 type 2